MWIPSVAITGARSKISPAPRGRLFSLLPPENASGNFVKVVQRLPVRIRFGRDQDPQHLLRPGMSVEPRVKVR
jgi:membrane fusion protein, multidrug efflux system